jgi:hypothetical protein
VAEPAEEHRNVVRNEPLSTVTILAVRSTTE